jgi:hypothetical protein
MKSKEESNLTKGKIMQALTEIANELIFERGNSKRSDGSRPPKGNQAFQVNRSRDSGKGNYNKKVSYSNNNNNGRDQSKIKCYRCQKFGHMANECSEGGESGNSERKNYFEKKTANHVQKTQNKKDEKTRYSFTVNHNSEIMNENNPRWIKDSGASRWYARDRNIFRNYRKIDKQDDQSCSGITGDTVEIEGIGDVEFESVLSTGEIITFDWKDVYHVPKFVANLVSTIDTAKRGFKSIEEGDTSKFTHNGKEK